MPVTTQLRVRYAETDQMGIVYYANYLVWFEIGRVELLRSLGLAYSQLETDHRLILPVVDAHCRYRAPARYDDEILIETWPSLCASRSSASTTGFTAMQAGPEPSVSSWPKARPRTSSATKSSSASRCRRLTQRRWKP
jgi:YbgC/YbaW family acyl-CoA thioester hydrolase